MSWGGATPPHRVHRWTRLLLLQQLCIEALDLLDPGSVRISENR